MSALAFELPAAREASEPPEARGSRRDQVRLLVASRTSGRTLHSRFDRLEEHLRPGDLLVLNVSATLPAAGAATRADGTPARVHFSTRAPGLGDRWRVVELRTPDGRRTQPGRTGERLTLAHGGGVLELAARYAASARLMLAHHYGPEPLDEYMWRAGEPISYGYLRRRWPLRYYQNVYATAPGSSEMASAGRPFTPELLERLRGRGVELATLVLHAGVSSPERHEPPFPEPYEVPERTAELVNATRARGGRVIAVGTTVVRALETTARSGACEASAGWTSLVISPGRELQAVDGLITGWHEPRASHLEMLEAVAGRPLLERSYEQALAAGYLWHEFGDSHLILP